MAVAMASTPRIAICITGFEHAFSEIEANVQYSIETLAAKRRPHVFGVVPSNRTWPLVERMLTRMGWMDDATISQQQPGNLTAPSNFWPSEKRRSFMLELWDCDQCHQMITESERAGGYRFDLISRFRLDLYWELPFHDIPDEAMPRGEIHVPYMSRCGGINDKFAVGERHAMLTYLTRVRRLFTPVVLGRKAFRSEGFLREAMLNHGQRSLRVRWVQHSKWAFCKVQTKRNCGWACTWRDCATRIRNRLRCEYLRCDYCGKGCQCWNKTCSVLGLPAATLQPRSASSAGRKRVEAPVARMRNGTLILVASRFDKTALCREMSDSFLEQVVNRSGIRSLGSQLLLGNSRPS